MTATAGAPTASSRTIERAAQGRRRPERREELVRDVRSVDALRLGPAAREVELPCADRRDVLDRRRLASRSRNDRT